MKKLFKSLVVLLLALTLFGCQKDIKDESNESKTIHVTIVDNSEEKKSVLFDDSIDTTGCTSLYDALEKNKDKLKLVGENGEYGFFILELMGKGGDSDKGPWWIYNSSNNETCIKMKYCPAVSELDIKDQDSFEFVLSH